MNTRTSRLLVPILLCITFLATASWAQDQGREFHWSGKLAADQLVTVKGISGNIDAEAGSGDLVEVTAEKSGPNADQVKVEAVSGPDGVTICAIYPASSNSCSPSWHRNNVRGQEIKVHFTIRMPKNLRFTGQNVNGDVTATGMGRFVRGESINGSVQISTSAWAEAETVNGSIRAKMGSSDWTGKLTFKSINGSVAVELPDDLSADIKFESLNGRISSDFPISTSGNFVGHSAKGRIGNGGRELSIETVNGSVELKKSGGGI